MSTSSSRASSPIQPHSPVWSVERDCIIIDGSPITFIARYDEFLKGIEEEKRRRIVWDKNHIVLEIRDPLKDTFRFPHVNEGGWTYEQLITTICVQYISIYREDAESMSGPTPRRFQRFLENSQSDGKYGIWGHDLQELGLDDIFIEVDGTVIVCITSSLNTLTFHNA